MSTLTPREQKRLDSDHRIIEAALKVIGQRGYTNCTLKDIAREAEVSQGLVSQRFESKENLLSAAILSLRGYSSLDFEKDYDMPEALYLVLADIKYSAENVPWLFDFATAVHSSYAMPDSAFAALRSLFESAPYSGAMQRAQNAGLLPEGDLFELFRFFMHNACTTIKAYRRMNLALPDDANFLSAIRYDEKGHQQRAQQQALYDLLKNYYYILYVINIADDTLEEIIPCPLVQQARPGTGAREALNSAFRQLVRPEYLDDMMKFTEVDSVAQRLEAQEALTWDYVGTNNTWSRCNYRPLSRGEDGRIDRVLFGVIHIQDVGELRTRLASTEERMQIYASALGKLFSLGIVVNLSKNHYEMVQYSKRINSLAPLEGNFDKLISIGASTIPDEELRAEFVRLFNCRAQLDAYHRGEHNLLLCHPQYGDDGAVHRMETQVIFLGEINGDIYEVSVAREVDSETDYQPKRIDDTNREERINGD